MRAAERHKPFAALNGAPWRTWLWQCSLTTAALGLVVALLRPARLDLGLINIALILLMFSVLSAAAWGWVAGLYTSLLSNLAFNFFFVPPLYRLSVQQPAHALALTLFLAVAAITASLLARRRQSAIEADHRARDTQTLLALSRTTRDRPPEAIPEAICARVTQDFPVRACTLYRAAEGALVPVAHAGDGSGLLADAERATAGQILAGRSAAGSHAQGARLLAQHAGVVFLPLAVEGEVLGLLRVEARRAALSEAQQQLLEAFADEAAAALQRSSLAAAARSAAVLQETDRLKSALLSSVSHDLRTPLTAIKTAAANLLSADVEWSETTRLEFLSAIDREADRLTRLVTNLLDLSRIEAGALRLDLDWNDLDELLREAIYRAERAAPERVIRMEAPASLPFLRFDYVQIDRVVANLLENAIKYSPPETPIDLSVAIEPDAVCIGVRDHGPGVPPAERERIFDPFYRAERRRGAAASGSGLGLAICRGIVAAHGGTIRVADSDAGALLVVRLPREPLGEPFAVFAAPSEAGVALATERRR